MDGEEWTIRPAIREDLGHLGALEAAGDAQFPSGRFPGEPGSDNVPLTELDHGRAAGLLWVAVGPDPTGIPRPVAFLLAREEGTHLYLSQVVVHPDWQRRGIGREMISRLEDEGRRRGASMLTLTTFSDITWNAPLYRRLGFQILNDLSDASLAYLHREIAAQTAAGMTRRVAMSKSPGNHTGNLEK